jgi:hypothetical protein
VDEEEEYSKKKKGFSKRYGGSEAMDKDQIEKLALMAGVNLAGGFDEEKFHDLLNPKLAEFKSNLEKEFGILLQGQRKGM